MCSNLQLIRAREYTAPYINDESIKFNYSLFEPDDMIFTDDDDKTKSNIINAQRDITVENFLYSHYKDCNGIGLFVYIYPVALGVREILVKHHHAQEAIELCKVIKEDMFKYMSYEAAEKIFEDVLHIQQKASIHTLWVPFLTPNNYKEASEEKDKVKTTIERKH
jgi:hypothetical protein